MLKSFGLVDNIWFDRSAKFPIHFSNKYTIHDLYNGNFTFKQQLKKWELAHNNSTGRYPYVIEVRDEYERKIHNSVYYALKNLISLVRLVKYNRVYLAHVVCFENNSVTMSTSTDDPRPSTFLGKDEEITKEDLKKVGQIVNILRSTLSKKKNLRILRALNFLDSSACSGTFERKVVELFIALESLFTTSHDEVTYKLSSRMAWLSCPMDFAMRTKLFKDIKKGYSIRSNIVHGKAFVESKDLPLIQEIHSGTRDILLKIIFDTSLLAIFTSDDEQLNSYFNDLVMGKI